MGTTVLLGGTLRDVAVTALEERFDLKRAGSTDDVAALPEAERLAIRGLAEGNGFGLTNDIYRLLPNLEIVAHHGVGYDGLDTDAAVAADVVVTNTPDVLSDEVADTTLGLLLMTVRGLSAAERYVRAGRWAKEGAFPLSDSLIGRSAGIVGYGRIGAVVAKRLVAFDMKVAYHSRNPRPDTPYTYYPDLLDMARDVDTLICILPGGAGTENLIDADVLAALGPRGVFVNVGRGSSVDEPALIKALHDKTISAAGLDVFANEPNPSEALLAAPNTVILPHVGSASKVTRDAMSMLVVDNLSSWFDDGKPLTPVAETPWPKS